ncbi:MULTISPECIES: AAA family ATPase [unclassified Paenibacillus]|uniref:AAA family ATPase n=1 Tax=unclassified Paenibacillus TaxID=185978 RepID=UPI000930CE0E|nr:MULTISPECIES: AAA family ATPase [unclassified Paenibacillus]
MPKLIFVIGPAGAGKTTVAKELARRLRIPLFDMDTLLRPAAETIMTLSGRDPNDRDSPVYKQFCRDLGYRITMDAALENLELGIDTLVVGPFTKETENPQWPEQELARIGAAGSQVELKVISVYLQDDEVYRERIRQRASILDVWKLENWDSFRQSLRPRPVRWELPPSALLHLNNSGPWTADKLAKAERFVRGGYETPPRP